MNQKSQGMTDSTVARIAGNLLSGLPVWLHQHGQGEEEVMIYTSNAVAIARAIVAEVARTSPSRGDAPEEPTR